MQATRWVGASSFRERLWRLMRDMDKKKSIVSLSVLAEGSGGRERNERLLFK